MPQIYTFRWSDEDKYGDEYFHHDFVTASTRERAWFIAGARISNPAVQCLGHQFSDQLFPITVEVYDPDDEEFWDAFEDEDQRWVDSLLTWAVEDRRMASVLWKLASSREEGCGRLLDVDELRSIAEQYELEQAIKAR